jgi:hypothetical protein
MRYFIKYILPFYTITFYLSAQQQKVGEWRSFTDMKSVRSAAVVGRTIWAATGGGLFSYDTVDNSFKKYTNVDGLDTNDLSAVAYDGNRFIWIGGSGGWVDVYDLNTGQWRAIYDITINSDTRKGIQSFTFKGDTVFIITENNVSVFKTDKWEFADTYRNMGFPNPPYVKCMTLQQDRIWVGTESGIATATFSNINSWTVYMVFPGLSTDSVTALAVYNDTLIIGTGNGAAYFAGGSFGTLNYFDGKFIRALRVDQGRLIFLSGTDDFTVESVSSVLDVPRTISTNSSLQGTDLTIASSPWIATASKGLAHMSPAGWTYIYPNCPNSNFFNSLVVDGNGVLWCASGETPNTGFYRYDPSLPENERWKNFTGDNNPLMWKMDPVSSTYFPVNACHNVSLGANGSVWVATWGDGFLEVAGDTIKRKLTYPTVANVDPAPKFLGFVVGGGTAVDDDGKTWLTVRSNSTNNTIFQIDDNSMIPWPTLYTNFHSLIVDRNGTKWIGNTVSWKVGNELPNGLYYFNERKIIPGTQLTNGWGRITGMENDLVVSLALDHDGAVWVGYGSGLVIIPDPIIPSSRYSSYVFSQQQQSIQSIAVDALNNKWIGTKEGGAFVINQDGTEILQNYTIQSTSRHLLAQDVRAVAIDQKRGIVYFGTERGLSSLGIGPVQTERSYSKLEIGPNPFILPSARPLVIRNLVPASTIKILTVNGTVIAQFDAQGAGRAFWDGRDKEGLLVSSGIYFIVAFAENGSQTVTGKVAVVRR